MISVVDCIRFLVVFLCCWVINEMLCLSFLFIWVNCVCICGLWVVVMILFNCLVGF